MKKIIGYMLLAVQIIFLVIIVSQFEHIDRTADEINIVTTVDYLYIGEFEQDSDLYVDYEINKINNEKWKIKEDLNYNRPVYVTLAANDAGIHEVKTVTEKKPKQREANEVVVKANYNYVDDKGNYYVNYGFERLKNVNQYGSFRDGDDLLVTVLLGKWGQQKVVNIEKQT